MSSVATAVQHVLQVHLLLNERRFGRGDVVGSGAGLQRSQLGLGAGQTGARLQGADLGALLVEGGERVAGFDVTADVDQQRLDATGDFGQYADLLAGADVAAVRQGLLNGAARGGLGSDWRGGHRRRRRGGGAASWPGAARADQQAGGQRSAEQHQLGKRRTTA